MLLHAGLRPNLGFGIFSNEIHKYLLNPCSKIRLTAGHRTPLTRSVMAWVTLSSPANEYSLLRSSKTSTNLAGNHPCKPKKKIHVLKNIAKCTKNRKIGQF